MKPYLLLLIFFGLLFSCSSSQPPISHLQQDIPAQPPGNNGSLDSQLGILTQQIVSSLSQEKKSRIAVIEFSNLQGQITELGRYLAEELITRLYRTRQFDVIERQMLNKVLAEHQLGMSGIIDASSAKELGKILGVDAIATGTVTDLADRIKIHARLISTETGSVFSVASVAVNKDETVRKLLGEAQPDANNDLTKPDEAPAALDASIRLIEKEGVRLEVSGCELQNRTLTIHLTITNLREDARDFMIQYGNPPTKVYDNLGNEYWMASAEMANTQVRFHERGSGYQALNKKLVPGVAVSTALIFENISTQTSQISLLEMNCGRRLGMLEFRNIPVTQ